MSRSLCNDCGASRGLATYQSNIYCFSCKKIVKTRSLIKEKQKESLKIPKEQYSLEMFPLHAKQWLNQYLFDDIIIEKKIFWSPEYERICFPTQNTLNTFWMRSLTNIKNKWLYIGDKDSKYYFAKSHVLGGLHTIVFVEDCISAIKISKLCDSFSLSGTNINFNKFPQLLKNYKNIIVWLDGDDAGRNAAWKFVNKYKLLNNIRIVYTKKDPKEYTMEEMKEILK